MGELINVPLMITSFILITGVLVLICHKHLRRNQKLITVRAEWVKGKIAYQ